MSVLDAGTMLIAAGQVTTSQDFQAILITRGPCPPVTG